MKTQISLLFSLIVVLGACAQDAGSLQARKVITETPAKDLACEPSETDGNEFLNGIVSGKTLKPGNIFSERVVLIFNRQGSSKKATLCTGTLITNDVILTAAHCVRDEIDQLRIVFSNNISCREQMTPQNTMIASALRVARHQDFSGGVKDPQYDVALIQMKGVKPSHYRAQALNQVAPIENRDRLVQIGYGVAGYNKGGEGRLRITPKKGTDFSRVQASNSYFFIDQKESGVCSGDSGGPLMRLTDKGLELIGVATSVAYSKTSDDPCKGFGVYLEINSVLPWIQQEIQNFRSRPTAK